MDRVLIALALFLLPGLARGYQREEALGRPGVFLYWANRLVGYSINAAGSDDLPISEVSGAIKRASFTWASPSCTDIYFELAGLDSSRRTNLVLGQHESPDRKNLLVWHEHQWPPDGVTDPSITDRIPALTTIIYDPDTGTILDADIDLNGYHFRWSSSDDPVEGSMDLESVVTHELGHLLGLAHSPEPESTMYGSLKATELKKRTLAADDLAGICFIYPYQAATPPGPGQGTIPSPEPAGCSVSTRSAPAPAIPLLLLGLLLLARRGRRARG